MYPKGLITIKLREAAGNIVKIETKEEWEAWKLKIMRDKKTLKEDLEWLIQQQKDDENILNRIRDIENAEAEDLKKIEIMELTIKRKREEIRKLKNILEDWDKYNVFKYYASKKSISEIFLGRLQEVLQWQ